MKLETLNDAIAYAVTIASYAGHATVHLLQPDGDEHRHWLSQQEMGPAAGPEVAIDTEAGEFVAEAGEIPGEALFRFAAGRGLHGLPYDSWAEQPIAVRLPIETFISTFLAARKLAQSEVATFEAAMREADAIVQRTPVRDTIFANGDEDGPLEDFGPVGQAAAPEGETLSVGTGEPDAPAGAAGDAPAGAAAPETSLAGAIPADGQANLDPPPADAVEAAGQAPDPSAAAPATLPAGEPLTEAGPGDTQDAAGDISSAGAVPDPVVDDASLNTAGAAETAAPASSPAKKRRG